MIIKQNHIIAIINIYENMYNIKLNLFIYKSFNNSILIILIIILNLI